MDLLVINGSARGDSHTLQLVDAVLNGKPATRLDLFTLRIEHYQYDAPMERDDLRVVTDAMAAHAIILFATPVYWYAMSGRMKALFDRFTDLVTVRKDVGRRLRGKRVVLLACGAEALLPEGFEVPFRDTAEYFSMVYSGAFYGQTNKQGLLSSSKADAAKFGESSCLWDGSA